MSCYSSFSSRTRFCQLLLVLVLLLIVVVLAALLALALGAMGGPGPALEVSSPPAARRRPLAHSVPSVMMELFHRGPHDQLQAEIVRSLTPRTIDRVTERQVWEHLHLLTFDLPGVVSGESLHSAQLRLSLALLDTLLRPVHDVESSVRVYWDTPTSDAEGEVLIQEVHDKRVTFNCTQLVLRFLTHHNFQGGELRLVVGVTLGAGVRVHTSLGSGDQQPLLLLLYSPTDLHHLNRSASGARERRETQTEAEAEDYEEETNRVWGGAPRPKKHRNLCRRRSLYVDFAEIDYDSWIVAPNGYQAYQCVGKCMYPLSDHLTPTKHAIVQTLVHDSVHPAKTPRACCVPTRLDSISVLYLDAQGVLTYRLSYKDMVAAECGCR